MAESDNLVSIIAQVDSILTDIEHRNIDLIGERYAELKTYVENEIKLLGKSAQSAFIETMYLPALNEFILSLKPKKGTSDHAKIYDALLDGVGQLKWYESQVNDKT